MSNFFKKLLIFDHLSKCSVRRIHFYLYLISLFFLFSNYTFSGNTNSYIISKYGYTKNKVFANLINSSDTLKNIEDKDYTIILPVIPDERFITVDDIISGVNSRKKNYLTEPKYYSYNIYTKGMFNMPKIPESILGFDTDTSYKGVFYLSESLSEIFHKNPIKYKEIVKATRISGDDRGVGLNYKFKNSINLYCNLIYIDGFKHRGIVSPLSVSASFYYDFELQDAFYSSGYLIHKIKVIPKRKHDPVFKGYLYVVDSSWDVYAASLILNSNLTFRYIDSLTVSLQNIKTESGHWLPEELFIEIKASHLAYEMYGYFKNYFSDYKFYDSLDESIFKYEKVEILPEAILKLYEYWDNIRHEPLTSIEKDDYIYRDSLYFLRRNIKFNDSLDAAWNKMIWYNAVFSGYTFWQNNKNIKFIFRPLLLNINYNFVEGLNLAPAVSIRQSIKDDGLKIDGMFRYSFGREEISTLWEISQDQWGVSAGRLAIDFNQYNPYNEYLNSIYTLFTGQSRTKMFEKTFFSFSRKFILSPKIDLNTTLEFAQRDKLENTVFFNFKKTSGEISHNNPIDFLIVNKDEERYYLMERHESIILKADLTFMPGRVYARYPNHSLKTIEQKLPVFTFGYRKGIPGVMNSLVNYDLISLNIKDNTALGLAGNIYWFLNAGSFVNKRQMLFPDFYHFNTNNTFFNGNNLEQFQLLSNYLYSTRHRYIHLHAEHRFMGFVFNKLPYLRKTGINLLYGVNAMHLPHEKITYIEPFISIDNVFGIFRFNFIGNLINETHDLYGFSIGIKWPYLK